MNLLEHEAKQLLKDCGIATPQSSIWQAGDPTPADFPVVVKSQVPVGGRGKLGGIKIVENVESFKTVSGEILNLDIKGFKPNTLLLEEKIDIKRELYLSLRINRENSTIELLAHPTGGVEIEEQDMSEFFQTSLERKDVSATATDLTDFYNAAEVSFALHDLLENLLASFIKNDATLIEINPLVITTDNQLVAGDAKMTLDDSAQFRHPEWKFENMQTDNNFVTLNEDGVVATVANGAGLAMATVDAVQAAGIKPANFLDIGGGSNTESVVAAFKKIMEYPDVKAIVINIFAGIVRCDEVAKAIITAKKDLPHLPSLHIRLAGTNFEAAQELLAAEDIPLLPTLQACIESAKEAVR